MSGSFRLAIAQITSTDQSEFNLNVIDKLYEKAAAKSDLVVFPENSLYFRIRSDDKAQGLKWRGPEMARLQKTVDARSTPLMLTTALHEDSGKLSNSTLLFKPKMEAERLYNKVHLFDV